MKKLILLVLLSLTASNAYALGPYDLRATQRDSTNMFFMARDMAIPAGGANGVYVVDGSNTLPIFATLGSNLTYSTATNTLDAVAAAPRYVNNNASHSIVTSTGATGFQISTTRDTLATYSVTTQTTASIAGNASEVVVFEICATNSATAGDWIEVSRIGNAQALSLAITLQSVQTVGGKVGGYIPAGWYAKIRSISSGTASATYNNGQEILL